MRGRGRREEEGGGKKKVGEGKRAEGRRGVDSVSIIRRSQGILSSSSVDPLVCMVSPVCFSALSLPSPPPSPSPSTYHVVVHASSLAHL